jgi:rhamnose transport system ATP-binding protein
MMDGPNRPGAAAAGRENPLLLEMRRISKSFGGVQALMDVDLEVSTHSVHAVVGENGAGKSTLMKILSGALQPDTGEIRIDGSTVSSRSPREAANLGVQTVYQEPSPYLELTVTENLHTGHEVLGRFGGIDWGRERELAAKALNDIGLPEHLLDRTMGQLPIGIQQLIFVARAVSRDPRILILDEPTSMLSQAETDTLFRLVRRLRESGTAVLYISHRLEEVFDIADQITVLRDGRVAGAMPISEADEDRLIRLMSGRHIERSLYGAPDREGEILLEVDGLARAGHYRNLSFDLRRGEILGVYGIVGSGRSEFARAIFGAEPPDSGEIRFDGRPVSPSSPREAIGMNIAYLAEDRRSQGLFLTRSVAENLTTAIVRRITGPLRRILPQREHAVSNRVIENLKIRTPSDRVPVLNLSGGSQQKVMFGRWLLAEPQLLILDEPTRGIDVGTKVEMHRLIVDRARKEGDAVLLISSELAEVLSLSDRVMVMRDGEVQAILSHEKASEQMVLTLALGADREDMA